MSKIVVVGMARTPMGAFMGQFASVSAPELGAAAIRGALDEAGLAGESVDQVIMGNVIAAGVGQAPARQAALLAGLPTGVSAMTINKVCGSGMKALMLACQALKLGQAHVVVAGGMENMSRAPYLLSKARGGYRAGHSELVDAMYLDGLQDAYSANLMGVYAEATAERYGFTREQQDVFALASLERALAAAERGATRREISPVHISGVKGDQLIRDDEPLHRAKPDKIPELKPVFRAEGTVTAANASAIADGAAALVLTTASYAEQHGLSVIAQIEGDSEYAHEPAWFTTAPVGAVQTLLKQCQWSVDSVELFELNEAFAVVPMAAMQDLGVDHERLNIRGGACALGHPLGASGARIVVTLIAALEQENKKRGVASVCIGGGEAVAIAVSRA